MNQQILAHWLKEGEHQYKGEATVISQQFRTNLNENNSETIPRVALSELSEAQISNNVISQRIKLNSNSINHQATNVLQIGVTEQEESSAHQSMVEGSRNDASATNLAPTNILIDTNPTALNTNVIRFDSTTKTFKCPIVNCEKGYKTRAHVKRHMFSHGDRTFECSTCSNRYYTGEDLKRHQKSHSRTSNLNAKRSKRSKTNKRLANSNSINHQATSVLQIGVTEQEESSAHQSMVEGSSNDASSTNLAPTNILIDTNPTATNTDVIRYDSTTKTFKCPIVNCEKGYKTRAHVKRHMLSHGDRTFECLICSKSYYNGEDLKRHQKSHSRTSNLNAKRSKRSKTKRRLANSNSINQATSVLQIGVTEQEESSAHQSMVEGSSNDASTTYLAPTNISNDTNPTESNTQIQETNDIRFDSTSMTYKCPIAGCDKRYKSKYHVERHMFSHGDPTFECLICSKKYYTGEALKRHQICHSTSKKYECSYKNCNKRYNRKSDLGRHIRFIHKTTVCTCPFCGKQYSTHGGYSSHLKLHNSFKCDICQKLYATQRKLELHKKSIHL